MFALSVLRSASQCSRAVSNRDSLDGQANDFSHLTIADESRDSGRGTTEFGENVFGQSSQSFTGSKYFKEEIHFPIWILCFI